MVWCLAELVKVKGRRLDVVVMNETADKPEKIKGLSNTPFRKVIGIMHFHDSDSTDAVLIRFNADHPSIGDVHKPRRGGYAYLSYPLEDESRILMDFCHYFKHDR